ncbi:MAG: hypothetical protein AAF950_11885 [Pseudomonadota bacterium]
MAEKTNLTRWLAIAGAGVIGLLSSLSNANTQIIYHIRFETGPVVIVWGDTAPGKLVVPINSSDRGALRHHEIGIQLPLAGPGELDPIETGLSSTRSYPLESAGRYFHVASNAPFYIDAQLISAGALSAQALEATVFRMGVQVSSPVGPRFGSSAQYPHSGGQNAGFSEHSFYLSELRAPKTVYRGNRKTAARQGSIADQSVRFVAEPVLSGVNSGNPLSHKAADILFTVYTP